MSDEANTASKKPKGRSPNYPAISLKAAIERGRQLWEHERQHSASVETIVGHWGYKALSGPALTTLSALKKFGLTEDEGKGSTRRARLTDLAVEILQNPDEEARTAAIRKAALNPAIHRELWEKYGATPPSPSNLRWKLTREMGFTETGADEFIREYRETIAFAGLDGEGDGGEADGDGYGDTDDGEDRGDGTDNGGSGRPPPTPPERQQRRKMSEAASAYTIPLLGGRSIIVEGEFPVGEQDWTQFLAVLEAMKPGLVRDQRGGATDE